MRSGHPVATDRHRAGVSANAGPDGLAGHRPRRRRGQRPHRPVDYVPYTPRRDELPADSADFLLEFVHRFPLEERARGPLLARAAEERFTGPVDGPEDRHELVVTHNFLIGWLVRAVLDAPKWRWLGLNQCNAALTVIRCPPPGRPPSVLFSNDMAHLPAPLRWTGYPPELRITS